MSGEKSERLIRLKVQSPFEKEVRAFVIDRQARGLSDRTVEFYRDELNYLGRWLTEEGLKDVLEIDSDALRRYLLQLGERRNPGGVHAAFRTIRAFFNWYAEEAEPDNWRNPAKKLKPPKVPVEPLEPIPVKSLQAMLATCEKDFAGMRDRAILLTLLDTGCRGSEFVALDVGDMNMGSGMLAIRQGKGKKSRTVMLGDKAAREITRYLRVRPDGAPETSPLWVTVTGKRLRFEGLRQIIRRRALKAGVPEMGPHAFRRAFALMSLRNGMDIYSLQKLMGHADLYILRRYLAQNEDDLRAAHEKAGPVDKLF